VLGLAAAVVVATVAAADMHTGPRTGGPPPPPPSAGPGAPGQPQLWLDVPVDPYEHERMYWKRRSPKDYVPAAIAVDRDPYVCDLDRQSFADADRFAAHLRTKHGVPYEHIRAVLVEVDGVYHYAGE
jgi:hypothetical protein